MRRRAQGEDASKVRGQWEGTGSLGGGVGGNQEPACGEKERGESGGLLGASGG